MLTSLRAVARHRPGLFVLTAMTVPPALSSPGPLTIGSGLASVLALAGFAACGGRIAGRVSGEVSGIAG